MSEGPELDPAEVMRPPAQEVDVDPDQLDLALKLVDDAMALDWAPQEYEDPGLRRFEELIEAKAQGRTVSYDREAPQPHGTVVDLDQALRRSVAERMEERRARQAGRQAGREAALRAGSPPSKKELLARARSPCWRWSGIPPASGRSRRARPGGGRAARAGPRLGSPRRGR